MSATKAKKRLKEIRQEEIAAEVGHFSEYWWDQYLCLYMLELRRDGKVINTSVQLTKVGCKWRGWLWKKHGLSTGVF